MLFLPLNDLLSWTNGSGPFHFAKSGPSVLANYSLCGAEAIFFSAGPVHSGFSAEACVILQALCWSRQHQQDCYFSSFLFSDTRSVLATPSPPPSFLLYHGLLDGRVQIAGVFSQPRPLVRLSEISDRN